MNWNKPKGDLSSLVLLFLFLSFRPISGLELSNTIPEKKNVIWLHMDKKNKDFQFQIDRQEKVYYVNRGLEKEMNWEDLECRFIELRYADYWTQLNPFSYQKHVAEISLIGHVFYSEIR